MLLRNGLAEAASPSSCRTWHIVSSPNVASAQNILYGVAIVSPKDVWAVGNFSANASSNPSETLTEHWNGSQWSIVSSPSPNESTLYAVSALSTSDAWAVGHFLDTNSHEFRTLTEHWNGTSWSVVASPNVGAGYNDLYAVAAISANNVWAVGDSNSGYSTLIEHWNGTSWNVASSPNGPSSSSNELRGMTAISAKDIWAVGDYTSGGGIKLTLTEHWNGTSWSIVKSPNIGSTASILYGVSAVSTNDVWAVGYHQATVQKTLIEHWDGTRWSVIRSPNAGTNSNQLLGVAAISATRVWAVGYHLDSYTLTEQWNGTSWSIVNNPSTGSVYSQFLGVAASPSNALWAVGFDQNPFEQTLTESYC